MKALADMVEQQKLARLLSRVSASDGARTVEVAGVVAITQVESKTAKGYTLQEWFAEWLNSFKVGNVRACTIDGFKIRFRNLKALYDVPIAEITNLMLSRAINEVKANATKDAVHNLIKQMFAVAFNNRLIETNPAASIPRPKQFAKNEKRAFTQEQEKKFIAVCLANLEQYEPLLICLLQGLRKGEMLALRPNDFDFASGILRIDESYDSAHPEDLQTKNEASNRKMPMFELTRTLLLKYAGMNPNERIYTLSNAALAKRLEQLFNQNLDLPRLTTHELRHTFISRCHEKGIDEIIVQRWVGHAIGSRMTKAVYTHIADDQERKYIELLNAK